MIERRFKMPGKAPASPPWDRGDPWPTVYYFDGFRHLDMMRDSWHDRSYPYQVRWCLPRSASGKDFAAGAVATGQDFATRDEAVAKFDQLVAGLEKKGWRETEWSLTRRAFGHPSSQRPTKFWAVALNGTTLTVQFGKVCPGQPGTMGTTKPKTFDTPGAARAAYDKLIAARLAAKYREVMPRPAVPVVEPAKARTSKTKSSGGVPASRRTGRRQPASADAPEGRRGAKRAAKPGSRRTRADGLP